MDRNALAGYTGEMLTAWSLLRRIAPCLAALALACGGAAEPAGAGGPEETGGGEGDAGGADAGPGAGSTDGGSHADAGSADAGSADAGSPDAGSPDAGPVDSGSPTAPANALPGEVSASADNAVSVPGGKSLHFRFEAGADEHIALRLELDPAARGARLAALRWDGQRAVALGLTDSGPGLRLLAVHEPGGPRTYWARVDASVDSLTGARLRVLRTPFTDAATCKTDCDRLLQLPLPRDPASDGYSLAAGIYRYQFGRRDLLQYLRAAARRMASQGRRPFQVADLSQWDSLTPGTDVGAPRHVSHQRGKDVDIALYGTDEEAVFRSYCVVRAVDGGRECTPGTRSGLFEPLYNARLLGAFYASGRVTMDFLDRELIAVVRPAASSAVADGSVAPALLPLYSDGSHLQHWPNHDNHVHIRVSEAGYSLRADGSLAPAAAAPFEAP